MLLALMSSSWPINRDVNETGTFDTETETKILETGLETTMIVKLLRDKDIHTGC